MNPEQTASLSQWPIQGNMRIANHHEKPSDGTDTVISDYSVEKIIGMSSSTLNSPFQTPTCELWSTGREHTDAQHNTRAYVVQHRKTAAALHKLLCSHRRHIQDLAHQSTAAIMTALQLGYVQVAHHSGPALSGYFAQRGNLIGRGLKFFTGDLISVNQTSDNKGAICGCLWSWVTSVGGQGGWREYRKIFSTLSLQTYNHPICMNASLCFWQTMWCLVFYSQFVDSN